MTEVLKKPKRTVAVNARFMTNRNFTGVQYWSEAVTEELKLRADVKVIYPPRFMSRGILGHLWEQTVLPLRAKKFKYLISPANSGPILMRRQLVVFHDLMPFTHPQLFRATYRIWFKLLSKLLLNRAEILATPSPVVKDTFAEIFPAKNSQIEVIGAGVRPGLRNITIELKDEMNNLYFLTFGGENIRKNTQFLVDLWPHLNDKTVSLIVVARTKDKTEIPVKSSNNENVFYLHNVDDLQLAKLYSGSIALLAPSIAEGYGTTLLEALWFGIPFVSADTGMARKIAIENCVTSVLNTRDWISSINILTSSFPHPIELRNALRAHAQEFDYRLVSIRLLELIDIYY